MLSVTNILQFLFISDGHGGSSSKTKNQKMKLDNILKHSINYLLTMHSVSTKVWVFVAIIFVIFYQIMQGSGSVHTSVYQIWKRVHQEL